MRRGWVAVLWVAIVLATGCDRSQPASESVVRIGVLSDLEGTEGPSYIAGLELALDFLEAEGGLWIEGHRHRVELLFEDSRGAPVPAMEGARRLIQQGVVLLIGPGRSSDAIAVSNVVENARIPMVNPVSTHPETTRGKQFTFRVCYTDTVQGRVLGGFARDDLGAERAAVLFDDASAYNRHLAHMFREELVERGGTMVAFETYVTGEVDFADQLARIREADADLLFLPNYLEELPGQVEQVRAAGIDAILLGSDTWASVPFGEHPAFEGAYYTHHWHPDEYLPGSPSAAMVEAYRQAYGEIPPQRAVLAFDSLGLVFHVLRSAGNDPEALAQALADVEAYDGITGTVRFRGRGGDPSKRVLVARVEQGVSSLYRVLEPGVDPGARPHP